MMRFNSTDQWPVLTSVLCLLLLLQTAQGEELNRFAAAQRIMGSRFEIVLYAASEDEANRGLDKAFQRIVELDRILSDYKEESELNRLCRAAPTSGGVPVSDDLWNVLHSAEKLSRRTDGAFDITVGPLTRLWRAARQSKQMPSQEQLTQALAAVGYENVRLHPQGKTVELLRPKMQLDLGGIAKGYAVDAALSELEKMGIRRALVNGGGDVGIGQPPPGKEGWRIGVAPLEPDGEPSRFLLLKTCAIATSGDAWQFVEIDGRRYSHIVNPATGLGLTDRSSVTVIAPNCTLADGLASALSVLGPAKGIKLIEQTKGAAALVVRQCEGKTEQVSSKRFATYAEKN